MKKITLIILLFCVAFLNAQEEKYSIKNSSVNTKYSDFGVSYYGDSTAVFASTRKGKTIGNRIWQTNKQPFLELYKGTINDNGEISTIEKFSKVLNTKYHESNVAFTKDLKTVYFTRNNYLDNKFKKDDEGWNLNQLYHAEIGNDGEWTNIQAMPFNSDNYQTGHPALNNAEDKLYFISDMPGSLGLTDIFVVDINSEGTYGEPKNLGTEINTVKREMFPFIDVNEVLYYASDGFEDSKGGLDIYAIKLRLNTTYFHHKNLESPINSNKDDFGIVFQKNKSRGYFSSNRKGGKGDDDIYSFEELTPIQFDCSEQVHGVVKDKKTGKLLQGAILVLNGEDGSLIKQIISNEDGFFNLNLDCDTAFKVMASKENYTAFSEEFTTTNAINLELNLELIPKEFITVRDKLMVNIKPIYFDYDDATIRKNSAIELQKIVNIMKKYPEVKIVGGSHTDSRGNSNYNKKLSSRRAEATVKYIIENGINSNRISAKGYGETHLVNKCSNGVKCTDLEHQLNRRTKFVIVNPEVINQ